MKWILFSLLTLSFTAHAEPVPLKAQLSCNLYSMKMIGGKIQDDSGKLLSQGHDEIFDLSMGDFLDVIFPDPYKAISVHLEASQGNFMESNDPDMFTLNSMLIKGKDVLDASGDVSYQFSGVTAGSTIMLRNLYTPDQNTLLISHCSIRFTDEAKKP